MSPLESQIEVFPLRQIKNGNAVTAVCHQAISEGEIVRLVPPIQINEEDGSRQIVTDEIAVEIGPDQRLKAPGIRWDFTIVSVTKAYPLAQLLLDQGAKEVYFRPVEGEYLGTWDPDEINVVHTFPQESEDPSKEINLQKIKPIRKSETPVNSPYGSFVLTPLGHRFSPQF